MAQRTDDERQDIYEQFNDRVNMTPKELEQWLQTDASQLAGSTQGSDDDESVGHKSGRRILEIKDKKKDALDSDDYDHMNKVVNYISRHTKQRPEDKSDDELEHMTWTHSLRNWGHDPLK
jgi:hypothetical protein